VRGKTVWFEISVAGRYSFAPPVNAAILEFGMPRRTILRAMKYGFAAALAVVASRVWGEGAVPSTQPSGSFPQYQLNFAAPEDESVYAPPAAPRENTGMNFGGVNLDVVVTYLSDYLYRGVDQTNFPSRSKQPDVNFDARLEFNTGKLPHPFVGLFVNEFSDDPVSRFQEIRPYGGLEWTIRPFIFDAGVTSYIYPEREKFNTSEAFVKATFDDSILWKSEKPIISPYGFAAYDYDKNNGWYFEAGMKHEFVIEDTGITLTFFGDVGYINGIKQQFIFVNQKRFGFSHYDVGLVGTYSLNQLFHAGKRYGEWTLNGYLTYTAALNAPQIQGDTKVWGGVGIGFKY
jgi:hypothetical protein